MTTTSITSGSDLIGKTLIIGATALANRNFGNAKDDHVFFFNSNSTDTYMFLSEGGPDLVRLFTYKFANEYPNYWDSGMTYVPPSFPYVNILYVISFVSNTQLKYNIYGYGYDANTPYIRSLESDYSLTITIPNTFLSSLTYFSLGQPFGQLGQGQNSIIAPSNSSYVNNFYNGRYDKVALYNGDLFALSEADVVSTLLAVITTTRTNIINNNTYTFRSLGSNFLGVVVNLFNYNTTTGYTVSNTNITLNGSGTTSGGYFKIVGSYIETVDNIPTNIAEKILNRPSNNYIFTGSRLRAGTNNTSLRLSTANNQAIIDLCNNGIVDISASSMFINGLKVVTTSSGYATALTALQLAQNLDISGTIRSDGGIQIGSGVFGGTITKSSNVHEIIIDPFAIVGSNSTNGSNGTTQDASWTQLGLDINGEVTDDRSGFAISLNATGNIVAIASIENDGNGTNSGHVRIYQYNNNSWIQLGTDIDGEASSDHSGYSVILNGAGNIVAIGAMFNDGNGSNSGHVRIYQYNNNSWIQLGTDIDGEASVNQSGFSVSLNDAGNIVAIGAPINGGNGSQSGHIRIYQYNNNNSWIQIGSDIDGETSTNQSGYSVSLNADGNIVAIGAPFNSQSGRQYSGHARIYQYNNNSWIQLGQDIDGEAAYDNFGNKISLNHAGNIVAIGSTLNSGNGSNSGHVRIYQYNNNSWIQLGTDINGEAIDDKSSFSISLNGAGNIVAIGAPYNDGNGTNSGHVRLYQYNDPSWIQLGQDINGEASGDQSGFSVSLNANGNRVAIGAIFNDGNGSNSGHVRIYQYPLTVTAVTAVTDASRSVVIMGDLIVRGNTSTFFSTNVDVSDVLLTLASGSSNVLKSNNAGIQLGTGYASLLYNSSINVWKTNIGLDISGRLSLNGGIDYSGIVVPLNNSSQLPVTWNTYALKTTGLPASIGDASNTWIDASGYIISKLVLSNNSFIKIEVKLAYISSPKRDQTLSFRVLRSATGLGGSYNNTVFSDISLGSNMGVTLNNVYYGTFIDNLANATLTNSTVSYKLEFMRNCQTGDSISTAFGIVESSGNYISLQELYQPPIS